LSSYKGSIEEEYERIIKKYGVYRKIRHTPVTGAFVAKNWEKVPGSPNPSRSRVSQPVAPGVNQRKSAGHLAVTRCPASPKHCPKGSVMESRKSAGLLVFDARSPASPTHRSKEVMESR